MTAKKKGNPGWVKGVSGNPGGVPKSVKAIRDLIADRTESGVEMVDLAVKAMRGQVKGVSREYAHGWLSDRFFGKPKQQIDVTGDVGITMEHRALISALQLSPHERRERIAELKAREKPAELASGDAEPGADRATANGHAHDR